MIDVVIVNWNSGLQLNECILSLKKFNSSLINKIIIVDNNSTDNSIKFICDDEALILIKSKKNLGFSKACNLGSRLGSAKYILYLNPDAMVYENSLKVVTTFMEDEINSRVGICGVQLFNSAGHVARHCSRFPTPLGMAIHVIGLDRVIKSLGHIMTEWDHLDTAVVDHVIGAFFFVRRELFNLIDGFDENYFLYLEDLDFSFRAAKNGWKTVYLAEASAFHFAGGTSKQIKAKRLFYSIRSRFYYSKKFYSKTAWTLIFISTMFIEPISRTFISLFRLSWVEFRDTWIAYGMVVIWLTRPNAIKV